MAAHAALAGLALIASFGIAIARGSDIQLVGFDLAGAEFNYPAKAHKDAFQLILKNNINCTAHAGEAYGPESVAQAIHYLGAHRIGHGVRLREDGDLLNYVNDHRVPLEVCPSSNVQTGAVPSIDQHPIRFLYNFGVRVTVNTDNRLITDTSVSKELYLLHKHLGFTIDELRQIVIWGFKSAFLPFHVKQRTLRTIGAQLDRLLAGRPAGKRASLEVDTDEPEGRPRVKAVS